MNNYTDFVRDPGGAVTLAACAVSVYIDGAVSESFEVLRVHRAKGPAGGYAVLRYNPAVCTGQTIEPVEVERTASMGKAVSIRQPIGDVGTAGKFGGYVSIFEGYVDQITTEQNAGGCSVEVTARDVLSRLDRVMVYGLRNDSTAGGRFLQRRDVRFNPDGTGNRSVTKLTSSGRDYYVFAGYNKDFRPWTWGQVIEYLLSEYVTAGEAGFLNAESIDAITDSRLADDIDLTGLSVAQAVGLCCLRCGIEFKVCPGNVSTSAASFIDFYRPGFAGLVRLNQQRQGERIDSVKSDIAEFTSRRDYWPIVDGFIMCGEYKRYEGTFELVGAWDSSLEGQPQSEYEKSTSSDFALYGDVYRRWCLNEAGDYSPAPYNRGDAYDLSSLFEGEYYQPCRRVFQDCLTRDSSGAERGVYVEISYNSGTDWSAFTGGYDVLGDQCGIWISDDVFTSEMWNAISAATLKVRVTAVIQSDSVLEGEVYNGPVNSTAAMIEHVDSPKGKYRFDAVSPLSRFYEDVSAKVLTADEADDTAALTELARRKARSQYRLIERIEAKTVAVRCGYDVGKRLAVSNADRSLAVIRDCRSMYWIDEVTIDFQRQRTELVILRSRLLWGGLR
jgi:hypothetical protein